VTVGVLGSGVALNHPDLAVADGRNTVTGEQPDDFGARGDHGSHVAGIIAARGTAPTGVRGIAPGVTLRSSHVFGKSAERASNFDIAKAVDQATADGCDLLNLSLGGGFPESTLAEAINGAFQHGVLSVCATGNDGRQAVSFPAHLQQALAVSALGEKGTFPGDALAAGDIEKPFAASNAKRFIASFSNIGAEIDLTGPGVGIVSTVPDRGYAVMSGMSMACPAVTGRIAAMLSQKPELLAAPRDDKRTRAIMKLAFDSARLQGFGAKDAHFEGQGLI
jgi:subtilisin